ncbi:hypothetical protein MDOR_02710 [Mycolicibacterium doricum]|uniref:Uncharacterized protein n=1 Tax=Mycolicibacterium doricum TaxID=126673 RepID=A0A1X1TET2_9MYCO|nr:hypothetical protein [Mycolicibacterium doricum]MCV7267859.1 hypothetical protein [Mycolicibacterium doricum]ORV43028.1 hypothetical protein AWC01_07600 [Mycolicibacterium doricum]BBZ06102.1 hypothetical protein MDOR_02710 [Mycolicibacterium doricum]
MHELARILDEIDEMSAALTESSPVVPGSMGQTRPNPLYAGPREHRRLADRLTQALDLTNSKRRRP